MILSRHHPHPFAMVAGAIYQMSVAWAMILDSKWGGPATGAMRQRKLGSHTPPCHRRMVITTLFSVLSSNRGGGGADSSF